MKKDNDRFEVERSADGVNWESIASIQGAGTSDEQKKYSFLDNRLREEIYYYRLKQTDFNGDHEFSKVISVYNKSNEKQLLRTINLAGQEVDEDYRGFVIDQFSDGSSTKRLQ